MNKKLIFLFYSISILTLNFLYAKNPEIILPSSPVEVGDTFKVELDYPITATELNNVEDWINVSGLEVYEIISADTFSENTITWVSWKGYLMAFDTGQFQLGPIIIDGFSPIPASFVEVKLVEVDTTKAFMDIQEVPKLDFWWGDYFWWWIAIFLIGLIIAIVLWKKRNKKKINETLIINELNAHEWALAQLKTIEAQYADVAPENIKPFFEDIVQLFKKYLVYRYHWNAIEETSEELLKRLKKHPDFRRFRKEVTSLLNTSDLVKFAKASVLSEEKNKQQSSLENIIKATKYQETQAS